MYWNKIPSLRTDELHIKLQKPLHLPLIIYLYMNLNYLIYLLTMFCLISMRGDLKNNNSGARIEIVKRLSQLIQKDCDQWIQDSCPLASNLLSPIVHNHKSRPGGEVWNWISSPLRNSANFAKFMSVCCSKPGMLIFFSDTQLAICEILAVSISNFSVKVINSFTDVFFSPRLQYLEKMCVLKMER